MMENAMKKSVRFVHLFVTNIVPIALMWILAFAAVQSAERMSVSRELAEAGVLVAIVIAEVLAWKMSARGAFLVLALFFAWRAAVLIGHLRYGIHVVNGGPVNVTIALASILSFAVGALVTRRRVVES
jgi:hypothetical protein